MTGVPVIVAPLVFVLAFATGTALHELTHWTVAKLLGARIEGVYLVSVTPRVEYEAPSDRADRIIRGVTIPCSVLVLVACLSAGIGAGTVTKLALAIVGVAYVPRPRDGSDWEVLKSI